MKTLIIGIDGGSPQLIEQWKDELPNIHFLMDHGIFGKLESSIPPVSSPAWNCLVTGKNPGKIGIYDWIIFPFDKSHGFQLVNYTSQKSPALWDYLGDNGKKVIIMNIPITYPPVKVNGIMVCGLLTPPSPNATYTYPVEIKKELEKITNGYEIVPAAFVSEALLEKDPRAFLEEHLKIIRKHAKAAIHLMTHYEWDFCTIVFYATDTIQHRMWHFTDRSHPKYDQEKSAKLGDPIKAIYQEVDFAIGQLLEHIPAETNVIVLSDHGFGPLYSHFLINEWLQQIGLLKVNGQKRAEVEMPIANVIKNFSKLIDNRLLIGSARFASKIIPMRLFETISDRFYYGKEKYENLHTIEDIDWSKTKAYGIGHMGNIFINLKGRDPAGIVDPAEYEHLRDELIRKLGQITNPVNEGKLFEHIYRKEEIYHGDYLSWAPDIILANDDLRYVPKTSIGSNHLWLEPLLTGEHQKDGIFLAYGPDIKIGKIIEGAKIYDIAPTSLFMFDIPIPNDMDGRVLSDIFRENTELINHHLTYQSYSERERLDRIISRLRSKGTI